MCVTAIVHLSEERDPRIRTEPDAKGNVMVFLGSYATIIATPHQLEELESALARHRERASRVAALFDRPVVAEAATACEDI
jgi:hypothetical protein